MPQTETAAYNLEDFAAREPRERLRVAEKTKKRGLARINLKIVKIVAFASIFVALVCSVLDSQRTVTELTAKIAKGESALFDLQSEYAYLNNEMEMRTSLKNVEQYAQSQLGLVKLDQSQITYVERKNDEVIVLPETNLQKLMTTVTTEALSFMEYLAP